MIGYYAHSHGSGHCNYAKMFAKSNSDKAIVFSESPCNTKGIKWIHLRSEHCDGSQWCREEFMEPSFLHYAPIGLSNIMRRNLQILSEIDKHNIQLMIVDVSVEIAALMRVSSVPYAYIKMMGNRTDLAHQQAYRGAAFLIAYYPEDLEPESTPKWVKDKTLYLGFVTEKVYDNSPKHEMEFDSLLILGKGGHQISRKLISRISEYLGKKKLYILGDCDIYESKNVIHKGFVKNVRSYISRSKIVIAACGSNLTSEILSCRTPFLMLPQERPYSEQIIFSKALQKAGLGIELDVENIPKGFYEFLNLQYQHNDSYFSDFNELWSFFEWYEYDIRSVTESIKSGKNQLTPI